VGWDKPVGLGQNSKFPTLYVDSVQEYLVAVILFAIFTFQALTDTIVAYNSSL